MDILQTALEQGIAPAIVVAVYLLIIRLLDSKKESKTAKLNGQMIDCINNINEFLKHITQDIIDKEPERCNKSLTDVFDSFSYKVLNFVVYTLINNHIIKNKKSIIENLNKTIDKEYQDIFTVVLLYSNSRNKLVTKIDKEWTYSLKDAVIDIIYDKNLTKEQKIYQCSNKIKLYVDEYCANLINQI